MVDHLPNTHKVRGSIPRTYCGKLGSREVGNKALLRNVFTNVHIVFVYLQAQPFKFYPLTLRSY